MKRLKHEIKKRVKNSKKPFDVWYEEHHEQIGKVLGKDTELDDDFGMVKIKKNRPNVMWAAAAGIFLLIILVVSVILLSNRQAMEPQIPDLTFGEESVETVKLEGEEMTEIMREVPQLTKLVNITGTQSIYQVDDSVVMTLVSGELETANDFYLVEARIAYNDNFIFLDRWEYAELESEMVVGDTTILYESKGQDYFGMNVFFALTETETEFVYWKVSCIEGCFEELMQIMFG